MTIFLISKNGKGQTSLQFTVILHHPKWKCVYLFSKSKAEIEHVNDIGALQLAVKAGPIQAVDSLLTVEAYVNNYEKTRNRTALHIAVEGGHLEIFRCSWQNLKINVNELNFSGDTALHALVNKSGSKSYEIVDLLEKHGVMNRKIGNLRRESH